MLEAPQIIDFTYKGRRHWFNVWRYDTVPELHAALITANIRDFAKETIAYTDIYDPFKKPDECGAMYLLDKSINTLSHEATHMANGILARHGHLAIELTYDKAPPLEEELCELVGHITADLYSKNKYF